MIPIDIWMLFDIISGAVNIAAFNLIGSSTPDDILNKSHKYFLDYYMIVVLLISWLRFFSYFLVINTIAKLTITLFRMVWETLNFIFIVICYLMLMTTVFAILFRNANPEDNPEFGSLTGTLKVLIDLMLANY